MAKSIQDLIAGAKKAPKQHRDVELYLDNDISDQIAVLERELDTLHSDTRLGDPRPQQIRDQIAAIEAEAAESIIVLRFTRMPADEWAEITARCPQRFEAPVDRIYGYNVHDAARAAAPASGVRLIAQAEGAPIEEALPDEQWDELFEVMSGREFTNIVDAIFDLNDYTPQQRLDAARKASRAGTGATSN